MATKQIVLITGASAGLGYQAVRSLSSSSIPYDIIVSGRTPSKVEAAIKSAQEEYPSSHSSLHALQLDIESDDSIDKAVKEMSSKFDRIDVLVNNAGLHFFRSAL